MAMWSRALVVVPIIAAIVPACSDPDAGATPPREVVVFTALDRIYSEPILREFESRTGIAVRPVYDAEAAKTSGLVNRLIARRGDPECDVLWNNEVIQTESLAQMGLLEPYQSPNAGRIPPQYRDPEHRWTGLAARLRVVIYNVNVIGDGPVPGSLSDFVDPSRRGQAAIAMPFYGTTFTHVSLLHEKWGRAELERWLRALKSNHVAIAPGNGPVRDLVASGERVFGLTDTDDAHGAMLDGKPVAVAIPDADHGAILIPNTVALIAGCPHRVEGQVLIDYLLSPAVERTLAAGRSAQIPLGTDLADVATPWDELLRRSPPRDMNVAGAAGARQELIHLLREADLDR
jgi:iron(III) transport system substrate-binding protein